MLNRARARIRFGLGITADYEVVVSFVRVMGSKAISCSLVGLGDFSSLCASKEPSMDKNKPDHKDHVREDCFNLSPSEVHLEFLLSSEHWSSALILDGISANASFGKRIMQRKYRWLMSV